MPILKRRPTLANWFLVAVFLGVVFCVHQHLFAVLGPMLGLLMISLYVFVLSLPFIIGACIVILLLAFLALLLAGLLMLWRHLRKKAKPNTYYQHHTAL
jgi:hypothetical protein